MVSDRVANELRAALDTMRTERDQLTNQIQALESMLSTLGTPARRGPGRPKGSKNKRGPGRPPKAAAPAPAAPAAPAKRGPGRPKGSKNKAPEKAKAAPSGGTQRRAPRWSTEAREAARARMVAYWASRRKSGGKG